ncbi:MAG: ATP-binding protein [Spirochaetales bacterium]|nr:ATP-binding protein [Spirochaetales bacterium]
MDRFIREQIIKDSSKKIILITGPRQSGKTFLSKMLSDNYDYLNYDSPEHRLILKEKNWDRKKEILILDEIHKMKNWKTWVKGLYDVEGVPPAIIITGSAKLDTIRKMGDSLAGRYFLFRLHPFDIKETQHEIAPKDAFNRLLSVGGFPEPFLENNTPFYDRWKKSHLDIILRQDLLDLESVRSIQAIETLIELLKHHVGSSVSYASLSRDLEYDPKTVKRWLTILENLYIIFPVRPYAKNISRSLLKEPKYYFYDSGQVQGDPGVKLENIVACALLKEIHYLEDCRGISGSLRYLRTKDGKEIDFVAFIGDEVYLIEVKYSDDSLSRNFKYFENFFPNAKKFQLVRNIDREKTYPDGTEICNVIPWLTRITTK